MVSPLFPLLHSNFPFTRAHTLLQPYHFFQTAYTLENRSQLTNPSSPTTTQQQKALPLFFLPFFSAHSRRPHDRVGQNRQLDARATLQHTKEGLAKWSARGGPLVA